MRIGKIFYFFLVVAIIGVPVYWSWRIYSSRPPATDEWVFVIKAIDGDTIKIEGGRKVRYIGVDTPETKDPRRGVQCFGKEAWEKNSELVAGKRVRLEKDVRESDDFGRLLRYVWLDSGIMVNLELIEQGYAQSYTYPPDVKHQEKLLEAHRRARSEKRGLWGVCKDVKDRDQKKRSKLRKASMLRGFFAFQGGVL